VLAPRGATQFADGDQVCVFVARTDRPLLDLLFGSGEGEGR
jgi:NhaP-type Na+/H+ and K+/H+ antiporter